MANITENSSDDPWYKDLTNPELGVVDGVSNAAFFGGILGGLLAIVAIGGLIYHCKRKKELEKQVRENEEKERARANNKVAPTGDIYDEMEEEIARHEEQKKKLSKYLAFLTQKDGRGLHEVNQKRQAAQHARKNKGWF
ncbi:uncharacterized protein LOC127859946 [Dreissena polymorpha]|nr:uncharacterized protein LOC127859946 [Dreissena polymorpha]